MAKTMFISPAGFASYPHITKPDNTPPYGNGKYKTSLILTPEEAKPLIDVIDKVASTHKAGAYCKKPWKDHMKKEGDTKVKTGNLSFTFSSKFAPPLLDASNKPINMKKVGEDFVIGGGSKIRIAGEVFSYDKGISLQMHQVQIIDYVGAQRASMFDAAEGTFDGSEYEEDDTFTVDNSQFEGSPTGLAI